MVSFLPGQFPGLGIHQEKINRGELIRGEFDEGELAGWILREGILLEPFQRHKISNHLILTVLLLRNDNIIYLFKVNYRNITAMCSKSVQSE